MRIYILHILIFLLMIGNTACDDFLDKNPDNRAKVDTPEKIRQLLTSAYATRSYAMILECSSDNMQQNESKYSTNFLAESYFEWKNDIETGYDAPTALFREFYKAISNSNQALVDIEKYGNTEELQPHRGEALITRAYWHFVLANIYCLHYGKNSETDLGIPYMEKPETEVSPKYVRGTLAYLYEKIDRDIEEALPLIDDNLYKVPKYHFNKSAAYAFATRFNLYYGKYDKAIEYATKVLGDNPSSVLRDWDALAKLSTSGNQRTDAYIEVSNPATLLVLSTYSNWPSTYKSSVRHNHNKGVSFSETFHASGPWGDYTKVKIRPISYTGGSQAVAFNKMESYWETADPITGSGWPHMMHVLFSTDEVLLCRAEAYALKKNYQKAMSDMNFFIKAYTTSNALTLDNVVDFYNRVAYYTPIDPTVKKSLNPDFEIENGDQESLLQFILHARRHLTLHEGLRWSDIKRYGIEIDRRVIDDSQNITLLEVLSKDDPRRALQLPISVIGAGLEANPRK